MKFLSIRTEDGGVVEFEPVDSAFVTPHGGGEKTRELAKGLVPVATAVAEIAAHLREKLGPDEVSLEVGASLSAEVGWFVAKSQVDAGVKITLTWKASDAG